MLHFVICMPSGKRQVPKADGRVLFMCPPFNMFSLNFSLFRPVMCFMSGHKIRSSEGDLTFTWMKRHVSVSSVLVEQEVTRSVTITVCYRHGTYLLVSALVSLKVPYYTYFLIFYYHSRLQQSSPMMMLTLLLCLHHQTNYVTTQGWG